MAFMVSVSQGKNRTEMYGKAIVATLWRQSLLKPLQPCAYRSPIFFPSNSFENLMDHDSAHFKNDQYQLKFVVDGLLEKPFGVFSLNFCSFAHGSLILFLVRKPKKSISNYFE